MLNVLFFAQTRELIGEDSIQLEGDFATAEAVREHLAQKGDRWALALEKGKLLVAINQTLMPLERQSVTVNVQPCWVTDFPTG